MRKSVFALLVMFFAQASFASGEVKLHSFEELAGYHSKLGYNGQALIARDGEILFEKNFGTVDVRTGAPIQTGQKFLIGSVSKQFTSAAILKLRDEGKLSLEDPLQKYHPEFTYAGKVTLRNLLQHTSGIQNFTDLDTFGQLYGHSVTTKQILDTVSSLPLDFDPGTKWNYSNTGYVLLGSIVEKVSGMSWNDYINANFLIPLGMTDTGYEAVFSQKNRAQGHLLDRDYLPHWFEVGDVTWAQAAGGISSTVEDLLKWDLALERRNILSPGSLDEMETPGLRNYGYGLAIDQSMGEKTIWHNGRLPGFTTMNLRVPARKLTVVTFSNFDQSEASNLLARDLAHLAIQGEITKDSIESPKVDPAKLRDFAGTYWNKDLSVAAILTMEDGKLYFMLDKGTKTQSWLVPRSETDFDVPYVARFHFDRDAQGAVQGFTVFQSGQKYRFLPKEKSAEHQPAA